MLVEAPNDDVLEEVFLRSLNMAAPLQARKWLALLEPDEGTGFRIRRNLTLERETLGFTFSSNSLGLRGPCDLTAPTVIFGTSYAMGFAVDNGGNWYDGISLNGGVMNLGFPVGLGESEALFRLYRGPCHTAVFLYHPNIWAHSAMYSRWRASESDICDYLRWDVSLCGALDRTLKILGAVRSTAAHRLFIARIADRHHLFNPRYAWFDPEADEDAYAHGLAAILRVLERFDRVILIRIPTKEELALSYIDHPGLAVLSKNHRAGWEHFSIAVARHIRNYQMHEVWVSRLAIINRATRIGVWPEM